MNLINYSRIGQLGAGFTNQIFCLITSIIMTHYERKKIIIIDNFYSDYSINDSGVCISKIFDIVRINNYLKKYDVLIFDKYNVNFKINNVYYGFGDKVVNLTDKVIELFYKDNTLHIPKNTNLNSLCGDPCFGIQKILTIDYSLSSSNSVSESYNFVETFSEMLNKDIVFDIFNAQYKFTFGWIDQINRIMFDDILCNIHYNPIYQNISDKFFKNINSYENNKINVLHLRLEDDAIKHWSKMNGMDELSYKNYIINKYIELIRTYVDKNDENIILSYFVDNEVIDFMKNNEYKYKFIEKNNEGREVNAIIDLLISTKCNNIFIGNYNAKKLNGSSFSYYVSKKLVSNVKQILIDPDHITDKEYTNF